MLHVVILAGGSGTRFWPLSRRDYPKQFLKLASDRTLLQGSFERVAGLVPPENVWVVTSEVLAAGVAEQLPSLPPQNLLVEPRPRNTAIAIGLAAGLIQARDAEAVLAVTPSDHQIEPASTFHAAIAEAEAIARAPGTIVTFGISPGHPHTGYGYIRRGEPHTHAGATRACRVRGFTEKPDRATAERYLASGEYSWNSGIFVWSARTVLDSLLAHAPETHAAIERVVEAWERPEQEQVLASAYEGVESISIDYAVLERADDVVVLEASFAWSDIGSWAAIRSLYAEDAERNAVRGAPFAAWDASGCLVHGDGRLVAVVGLSDVMIVQTRDATLVCHRDRAEEVKRLVQERLTGPELEPYT